MSKLFLGTREVVPAISMTTTTSLNVTPSPSAQIIRPEGGIDGFDTVNVSAVTSAIDSNITAENIKKDVTILGVTGDYAPVLETTTVTPAITSQTITPSSGYDGFSTITVSPVTSSIDNNITTENIKKDISILGVTGNYGGNETIVIDREVAANGTYQAPTSNFTFSLPSTATSMSAFALYYAFYNCTGLTSVDLSSIVTIDGNSAMYYAFIGCTNLTSVDLSSLKTVSNNSAMHYAFRNLSSLTGALDLSSLTTVRNQQSMYRTFENCTGLTSVDLSSLTTINGRDAMYCTFGGCTGLTGALDLSSLTSIAGSRGFYATFDGCSNLTSIDLSNLTTISKDQYGLGYAFMNCSKVTHVDLSSLASIPGNASLIYAFRGCTSLYSLSFPALTSTSFGSNTNQFNRMLYGVTGCTVHFPSNLQSVIGSWADVTGGFGGTNTTVLFDLPATA